MINLATDAANGNATSARACSQYPDFRTGWLHTLNCVLARADAGREVGIDAMLLILAIAVAEDALQYRAAPTLFFAELQRMLGFRSRTRLERARQTAIDTGWLVLVPGPLGDLAAARYWTVIPARLNLIDDAAQDVVLPPEENDVQPANATSTIEGQSESSRFPLTVDMPTTSCPQLEAVQPVIPGPVAGPVPRGPATGATRVLMTKSAPPVEPHLTELRSKIPTPAKALPDFTSMFPSDSSIPLNAKWRDEIIKIYSAYPRNAEYVVEPTEVARDFRAINRAMTKISFADLLARVNVYAKFEKVLDPSYRRIPSLVSWFEKEQWRFGE